MSRFHVWRLAAMIGLTAGIVGAGCQRMTKAGKHWQSGWDGLDRTISVYTDDGRLHARWNAKTYIETRPPVIAFIDSAGKEVKVMGGIVIVRER